MSPQIVPRNDGKVMGADHVGRGTSLPQTWLKLKKNGKNHTENWEIRDPYTHNKHLSRISIQGVLA